MGIFWFGTVLIWNYGAFNLETLGINVFVEIWLICLTLFAINV